MIVLNVLCLFWSCKRVRVRFYYERMCSRINGVRLCLAMCACITRDEKSSFRIFPPNRRNFRCKCRWALTREGAKIPDHLRTVCNSFVGRLDAIIKVAILNANKLFPKIGLSPNNWRLFQEQILKNVQSMAFWSGNTTAENFCTYIIWGVVLFSRQDLVIPKHPQNNAIQGFFHFVCVGIAISKQMEADLKQVWNRIFWAFCGSGSLVSRKNYFKALYGVSQRQAIIVLT